MAKHFWEAGQQLLQGKEVIMPDIYQITLTTQTGETFTGKMSRRQPELVNGFVPLATETGEWLYFAPADVKRVQFTPVPAEEETNGDVQTVSWNKNQVVGSGLPQDADTVLRDEALRARLPKSWRNHR